MTPLHFERAYRAEWDELETLVAAALQSGPRAGRTPIAAARAAALYRRACGHLALARARAYPSYLTDRLERITADAHQAIYGHRPSGLDALVRLVARDFPAAVRAHRWYVAVALALFMVPTLAVGLLVYWTPEMILAVVDAETAASFEEMYGASAASLGRDRDASTDWMMFGHYIRNNIGVAFQCFAGGLLACVGSLFFLAYNGAFGGAIGGYLIQRGLAPTFTSFVATHSAFELTAIVLAGAAGLRIGFALLAPGRATRVQSLVRATRETSVLLYGVTAMLLVAAAVEAFWSSSQWVPPSIKYSVAAVCWTAVLLYFTRQGRDAH